MSEKIARIIQEHFFPWPPTSWETMPQHQRQDFLDCAAEITGQVLTVSQQGPVVRLDFATSEEASEVLERLAPERAPRKEAP